MGSQRSANHLKTASLGLGILNHHMSKHTCLGKFKTLGRRFFKWLRAAPVLKYPYAEMSFSVSFFLHKADVVEMHCNLTVDTLNAVYYAQLQVHPSPSRECASLCYLMFRL